METGADMNQFFGMVIFGLAFHVDKLVHVAGNVRKVAFGKTVPGELACFDYNMAAYTLGDPAGDLLIFLAVCAPGES